MAINTQDPGIDIQDPNNFFYKGNLICVSTSHQNDYLWCDIHGKEGGSVAKLCPICNKRGLYIDMQVLGRYTFYPIVYDRIFGVGK